MYGIDAQIAFDERVKLFRRTYRILLILYVIIIYATLWIDMDRIARKILINFHRLWLEQSNGTYITALSMYACSSHAHAQ